MSAVAMRLAGPRVQPGPARGRRYIRVDVWGSGRRWVAGWSAMELTEDENYVEALNSRAPGAFVLVSRSESARAALLAADVPMPNIWREHHGSDVSEMEAAAGECESAAEAFDRSQRDH